MTDNKLTDEQIIQEATEAVEKNLNAGCYVGDLLRIIKEKKTENERLQNSGIRASSVEDWLDYCNGLKSEAIKEFAERLKERTIYVPPIGDRYGVDVVFIEDIDYLVKEMVGE